mmetsp:Transcript_17797/g.41496  ORF Transcript_17797/g.41496 Transcript_17797/m.41496 type:complete len:324 (-) Transcript_17797:69-1040(-)
MGARLPPVTVMVCFFFAMSTRVVVGLSRVGLGTVRSNCFAAASTARFFSNDAAASLPFEDNRHNSIMIKVRPDADASFDESTFEGSLLATEKAALHLGKTAVWIEVPILQSRFIELAANCGFVFHHAEGDQASLCKWIDTEHTSRIPCFATHQVGVGAVVINLSSNQILCVRELRKNYRPYKLPTGLAELGEDLDQAVVREVLEETGINTVFEGILGVRHTHNIQFGRSDLFFVCRLSPLLDNDGSLPEPVPQSGEIEDACWLSVDEYRDMVNSDDDNVRHPMMQRIMDLVDQGADHDIQRTVLSSVVPGRKSSPLYHTPLTK